MMSARHRPWSPNRSLPITAQLAAIVVTFVVTIVMLLGIVSVCLDIAAGVRAYVGAEGLWSKGQKDAVYHLSRYFQTHDEQDFNKYLQAVAIPLGYKRARLELQKPEFDFAVVEAGFLTGGVAEEDVDEMVFLFRNFGEVGYLAEAIAIWTEGDRYIALLRQQADNFRSTSLSGSRTEADNRETQVAIEQINADLTQLERAFSATLGEGARWIQRVLLGTVLSLATVLLGVGLLVSWRISHAVRDGLSRLSEGALQVSRGNLSHRIQPRSSDELGQLAMDFNSMIAHRYEAEVALKASRDMARSIIDTASDAFISMTSDGDISDWNRQAELTFGWSRAEAVDKNLAELIIPPQHREAHRCGLERFLRTGEGPVLHKRIEITALHREGNEFPIELTIWPVQGDRGLFFNAFLHDISERDRALRRLDAQKAAAAVLVQSANLAEAGPAVLATICNALEWDVGALWLPDPVKKELHCAAVYQREGRSMPAFTGVTLQTHFAPGIGLPGRVWTGGETVWIPDVTQDSNFPRAPFAQQDGLHAAFAFPLLSSKRVVGVIEFFSNAIQEPDQELLRMMETLGNLIGQFIGRQQAEADLAARVQELARSNAELEQFANVASHDLQEPLRTVTSFTQLLARQFQDQRSPDTDEYVAFITEAVQRMHDMIQGLLSYSRVSRHQENLQPTEFDGALGLALANLRAAIDASSAEITSDPQPTLRAEPSQIVQLYQNLIGNALKFRGAATPRIHVGARRVDNEWIISVSDNGIGIDPQHAERVFVLFRRLHTREQFPGNGLGLAICKKIVERHNGRIWVEPGSPGAIFRFALPA